MTFDGEEVKFDRKSYKVSNAGQVALRRQNKHLLISEGSAWKAMGKPWKAQSSVRMDHHWLVSWILALCLPLMFQTPWWPEEIDELRHWASISRKRPDVWQHWFFHHPCSLFLHQPWPSNIFRIAGRCLRSTTKSTPCLSTRRRTTKRRPKGIGSSGIGSCQNDEGWCGEDMRRHEKTDWWLVHIAA